MKTLLLIALLAQEPVEKPISHVIYFSDMSCHLDIGGTLGSLRGNFFAEVESAGTLYGYPVRIVNRMDKADYVIDWGHRRINIIGSPDFDCDPEATIWNATSGALLHHERLAALQKNRLKDLFTALKSIQ